MSNRRSSLSKSLRDLKKKATKAARKGVTNAVKVVNKGAKKEAPTETKTLKKSIGQKVKQYRKGTVVLGIVGPRKDSQKIVEVDGKPQVRDPKRYGTAVEYGHHTRKGFVAAVRYMRDALEKQAAEIQNEMSRGVQEVLGL